MLREYTYRKNRILSIEDRKKMIQVNKVSPLKDN